jgi:hypothetical protein
MRFYFDIPDKLAIRDEIDRDLETASDAVVYAKYLAADFRCLEPDARPRLSIQVIGEGTSASTPTSSLLKRTHVVTSMSHEFLLCEGGNQ